MRNIIDQLSRLIRHSYSDNIDKIDGLDEGTPSEYAPDAMPDGEEIVSLPSFFFLAYALSFQIKLAHEETKNFVTAQLLLHTHPTSAP